MNGAVPLLKAQQTGLPRCKRHWLACAQPAMRNIETNAPERGILGRKVREAETMDYAALVTREAALMKEEEQLLLPV